MIWIDIVYSAIMGAIFGALSMRLANKKSNKELIKRMEYFCSHDLNYIRSELKLLSDLSFNLADKIEMLSTKSVGNIVSKGYKPSIKQGYMCSSPIVQSETKND